MAKATSRRTSSTARASVHSDRLSRLRRELKRGSLESFLVTNPRDIRYLTGFHGDASYLLVMPRRAVVLSDFRFQEELATLKGLADVLIRKGLMIDALRELVGTLKPASMGIQAEAMTVETRAQIAKAVGVRRIRDTSGIIRAMRAVKDASEIALIRRAIGIQEAALLALLEQVKPGQSELEIAAMLEFEMKTRGSIEPSFDTIAAVRANGSLPHAIPGSAKAARGQPLLIDWGATYQGYRSDMTRTFSFGSWPKKLAEVYRVVLDAHLAGIAAIRPGAHVAEVDSAARAIIEKAGYGAMFGHGLGHGIGLDVHEEPRLSKLGTGTLSPGMVVTVEPGIYLPGVGGIRIEDDVLVTERGGRSLCTLPKDMDWATL